MKKVRVAINGFGRIGRMTLRVLLNKASIEVVAINDLTDAETLAHLFKYDSVHRAFQGTVSTSANQLIINGKAIEITAEKDPANLPWKRLNVDAVIESTGHFLTAETASAHLKAGASRVFLSAPPKDNTIKSIVMGVNDHLIDLQDLLVSNASCTTNCAAPMVKVLEEKYGIEDIYISTVHSYTGDQRLHDAPHKDLRRARAAALSIVPTSTGAAKAITAVFPQLEGRVGGCGIRVPVPDGSLTDITAVLKRKTTAAEINACFKKASESTLKGYLQYTEDPIVSADVIGSPYSCVFDADFTSVVGNLVKIIGWYDNEIGYSNRLAELILRYYAA